ncbi:MAG: hypothetical protein ACFCUL_06800 [Flavobacteriaceae bacterium]
MDYKQYDNYVNRIIASKSFGNSTTYANLLRYLVHCTLENDIPKETTIATDIFGKKEFDPSQSTLIRVYIYNLRKKIRTYYLKEGAAEKVLIKIPKGSYQVTFEEKKKLKKSTTPILNRKILWGASLVIVLSLIGNFALFKNSLSKNPVANSQLWTAILRSDNPIMLLMGDLFLYQEIDTVAHTRKIIRNPQVNSEKELEVLRNKIKPSGLLVETLSYSHLIRNSAAWIKDLSYILTSNKKSFTIGTTSRFNSKELPDNDIMVIGMVKTLGIFKDYINRSSVTYDESSDSFTIKNALNNSVQNMNPSGNPESFHQDYALMLKVPGPNNNTIYVFTGIWDTGASQSFKNFSDPVLVQELENRMLDEFGQVPNYFEVFFEVNGVERMELSSKILSISELIL